MSHNFWPYWGVYYDSEPSGVPLDKLVPCSPNNRIASYVVATLNNYSCYPQPGYVYYNEGSFSSGYFMKGTDEMVTRNDFYFLVGGNVSFRPHTEVPENLRFKVGSTKQNKPIYIGTINIGTEIICGPVIDGVCYANNENFRYTDGDYYNVLASNEG